MSEHKQLAIRALEQMRGDDLYRARAAFRNCTPEQMAQKYGQSGKTRAEILAGYEAHDAKVTAALAWVMSQKRSSIRQATAREAQIRSTSCEVQMNAANDDLMEAMRSAQELCAFLWHNTDAENPGDGNVELLAHTDEHATQLAALLNDARTRIDAALHGLEIQRADVGRTNQCTHPNCNCWMGVCSKGPHGPTSERLMRKFYGPTK